VTEEQSESGSSCVVLRKPEKKTGTSPLVSNDTSSVPSASALGTAVPLPVAVTLLITFPSRAMSLSGLSGNGGWAGVSIVDAWEANAETVPSVPVSCGGAREWPNVKKSSVGPASWWLVVLKLTN
jgi:hypothetical protein